MHTPLKRVGVCTKGTQRAHYMTQGAVTWRAELPSGKQSECMFTSSTAYVELLTCRVFLPVMLLVLTCRVNLILKTKMQLMIIVKYRKIVKNVHPNFPKARGNAFRMLAMSNQRSKTQYYLMSDHITRKRRASSPHNLEAGVFLLPWTNNPQLHYQNSD